MIEVPELLLNCKDKTVRPAISSLAKYVEEDYLDSSKSSNNSFYSVDSTNSTESPKSNSYDEFNTDIIYLETHGVPNTFSQSVSLKQ